MQKKVVFHIISHTHWDREWYLPFETYRIELVDLLDDLLNILEQNNDFIFHLDGYTLLIDDYLEIKPHQKKLIKKYIRSGNILTGPWYVLSDQFLTSGESTIRNLYYGISTAKSYGNVMDIGYLPDQFGQIAQLPQILKGFNIHSAILARGIQSGKAEHTWYALNNEAILAISLTHWYNNAQRLPSDKQKLNEYLNKIYEKQASTTASGNILLMNGCDHLFVQPDIPTVLKSSDKHHLWTLKQSRLPDVVKSILDNVDLTALPARYGELRDDNNKFILASTLSSRVYLKLKNYLIQTQLEKIIEPLASILEINRKCNYPYYQIKHAWKSLIQNHAHDSICGCSVDPVHKEMEIRFEKVNQLLDRLEQNLFRKLAKDSDLPSYYFEDKKCLQLFNLTNLQRNEFVEVEIEFPLSKPAEFAGAEKSGADPKAEKPEIETLTIIDGSSEANFIVLENSKKFRMVSSKHEIPALQLVQVMNVLLNAQIEPFSCKTYDLVTNENGKKLSVITAKSLNAKPNFENDEYKLDINNDGTLNIHLKKGGAVFENLHFMTLENDYGDLYRFIPREGETTRIFSSENATINNLITGGKFEKPSLVCTVIEENEFRKIFKIENKELNLQTQITCYTNCNRIDFKTKINNLNQNKRLRVHFPTLLNTDFITADTPFGVLERNRPPKEWKDCAFAQPLHNWINHSSKSHGLSFFGGGLAEYELYESGNGFAVTLIRSIGKLSIVKSHSLIETPDGECNREIEFNYGLLPNSNSCNVVNIMNEELKYQTKIKTNQSNLAFNVPSFIQYSSEIIISAFKKSEEKDNLYVLRLFNPTNKTIEKFKLSLSCTPKKFYLLNLFEEIIGHLTEEKNHVVLDIKPYQIITLGFEIK